MANEIVIRKGVKILGSLDSGTGDPMLTRDATDNKVGEIPGVDTSTYLSRALQAGYIFVGDSSNLAAPVLPTGAVYIDMAGNTFISNNVITNLHINSAAGIAYSKLNLLGSIVNGDIANAAGIVRSKLASGSANRVLVNNGSGVMAENAALTTQRVIVSDNNGLLAASGTTTTTLSYLDITSSLVTLLAGKLDYVQTYTPASGDIVTYNTSTFTNLHAGTTGYVLASNGPATNISWQAIGSLSSLWPMTINTPDTGLINGAWTTLGTGIAHDWHVEIAPTITKGASGDAAAALLIKPTWTGWNAYDARYSLEIQDSTGYTALAFSDGNSTSAGLYISNSAASGQYIQLLQLAGNGYLVNNGGNGMVYKATSHTFQDANGVLAASLLTTGEFGVGSVPVADSFGSIPAITTGAGVGIIQVYRQANNVGYGTGYEFTMQTNTAAKAEYAYIGTEITNNSNGAHYGALNFFTAKNAVLTVGMRLEGGVLVVGANTGGGFLMVGGRNGGGDGNQGRVYSNYYNSTQSDNIIDFGDWNSANTAARFDMNANKRMILGANTITAATLSALGQIQNGGYGAVGSNYYYDITAAQPKYTIGDYSSVIEFVGGGFTFKTAGIGVAGNNISYSTKANLDANGAFTFTGGQIIFNNSSSSFIGRIAMTSDGLNPSASGTSILIQGEPNSRASGSSYQFNLAGNHNDIIVSGAVRGWIGSGSSTVLSLSGGASGGTWKYFGMEHGINVPSGTTAIAIGIDYNPTLTSVVGLAAHYAWRNTSGNILIGATSMQDAVNNTMEVYGKSTSTGSVIRAFSGSGSGDPLFAVSENGYVRTKNYFATFGNTLVVYGPAVTTTGQTAISLSTLNAMVNSGSNDVNIVAINAFQNLQGTAINRMLKINPVYNASAGAAYYGVDYDPTVTSLGTSAHIAWRNTSGMMLVNMTTANSTGGMLQVGSSSVNGTVELASVGGGGLAGMYFVGSGATRVSGLELQGSTGQSRWYNNATYFPTVWSNGVEVARWSTSGDLGLGNAAPTHYSGFTLLSIGGAANGGTKGVIDWNDASGVRKGEIFYSSNQFAAYTEAGITLDMMPEGSNIPTVRMKGAAADNKGSWIFTQYTDNNNYTAIKIGTNPYWGSSFNNISLQTFSGGALSTGGTLWVTSDGANGRIGFSTAGTGNWMVEYDGSFQPYSDNTKEIGSTYEGLGHAVKNIWSYQYTATTRSQTVASSTTTQRSSGLYAFEVSGWNGTVPKRNWMSMKAVAFNGTDAGDATFYQKNQKMGLSIFANYDGSAPLTGTANHIIRFDESDYNGTNGPGFLLGDNSGTGPLVGARVWSGGHLALGNVSGHGGGGFVVYFIDNGSVEMGVVGASYTRLGGVLNSGTSTATPYYLSLGSTYSSVTTGHQANIKFRIFEDNVTGNDNFGLGVSTGTMEYYAYSTHTWYRSINVKMMKLVTAGSYANLELTTGGVNLGFGTAPLAGGNGTDIYTLGGGSGWDFRLVGNNGNVLAARFNDTTGAFLPVSLVVGGSSITNSSVLADFQSTTKGVVLPRMTNTQMNAIATPIDGMMVWNTTKSTYNFYSGGAFWGQVLLGQVQNDLDSGIGSTFINGDDLYIQDLGQGVGFHISANLFEFNAATTAFSSFRIVPGVAPTSPGNGDVWTTTTGFYARINGTTYNLITGGSGASITDGSSTLTVASSAFSFSVPTYGTVLTAGRSYVQLIDSAVEGQFRGADGNGSSGKLRVRAGDITSGSGTGAANDLILIGGSGTLSNYSGGNAYLLGGSKTGSGVIGNIGFHTTAGSFGGGEGVAFIADRITAPSSNPTGGGILYSESGLPKWRDTGGTTYDLGVVQTKTVSLTNGQIASGNTTPITIISAPGSGKIIQVICVTAKVVFGSAAWATNTQADLKYNGASSGITNGWPINQGSTSYNLVPAVGLTNYTSASIENKAVEFYVLTGNPTSGTGGTMVIQVEYVVKSI